MAETPISVFSPALGIAQRVDAAEFSASPNRGSLIYHAVNMRAENGFMRTRLPMWEHTLEGDGLDEYQANALQGALIYDPMAGFGDAFRGVGNPRIIEAAGGQLFSIEPRGGGTGLVKNIPGPKVGGNWLVAYLAQAENHVIRTDGSHPTVIYPGKDSAFFSNGYNTRATNSSQIPHAAGPTAYFDYRVFTTQFDRRILAGDLLGARDPNGTTDLLNYSDQRYLATMNWFSAPVKAGLVAAMISNVDLGSDARGQGELLVHHWGNIIFGIRSGVPRDAWQTTQMVRLRSVETAATGQYAVFARDGDQIFRSSDGIKSLKLTATERNQLGAPTINLGEEVERILDADEEESLRWCNLVNPVGRRRMFCTVSPRREGRQRWGHGILSANSQTQPGEPTWEGIWLPPGAECSESGVTQLLADREESEHTVYALGIQRQADGELEKKVWEMRRRDGRDFAGGQWRDIPWSILTKKLSVEGYWTNHHTTALGVMFRDVLTAVEFRVMVRTSENPERFVQVGKRQNLDLRSPGGLRSAEPGERLIPLGDLTELVRPARWVQFKVVGKGTCSIDLTFLSGAVENLPKESLQLNASLQKFTCNPVYDPYAFD